MAYDVVFGPGGQFNYILLEGGKKTLLAGYAIAGIEGGSASLLTIAAGGSVYRDGSYGAVLLQGGSVTNYGSVFGNGSDTDGVFMRAGSVTNYGTIVGENNGISFSNLGQGMFTLTNSGFVVGARAVGIFNGNRGVTTIVNAAGGTLQGTGGTAIDNSGSGGLNLVNTGSIIGNILNYQAVNDTVVNDGTIQGNVDFGYGNDTYSGVGRVTGTVLGGAGNDALSGGIYDDRLDGGANDDILDGGRGNDVMTGGAGNDAFYVDSNYDKVIEAAGGGTDTVYTTVNYALRAGQEIETLAVNSNADYANLAINLTGNEFANALIGNAAANKLDGKGGADTMSGGGGDDIYYVDHPGDVVVETANQGTDTVFTAVSHTLSANVEILRAQGTADIALTGNWLANTIVGNAGANRIDGGVGADKMTGGAGDDTYVVDNLHDTVVEKVDGGTDTVEASVSYILRGQVENLILTGTTAIDGSGNGVANTIVGNAGANGIDGKGGLDMLTGGSGADTFVFSSKLDAAVNFATITDFEHGVDRIALDDRYFKAVGTGGVLDEQFFTFSAPATRDQHLIYDQATGLLSYDSDGSGAKAAVAFAQVTPGTVLDHHDFLIV
jgi:Ca2+-binding RTX toxin-like protein